MPTLSTTGFKTREGGAEGEERDQFNKLEIFKTGGGLEEAACCDLNYVCYTVLYKRWAK